MSDFTVIASDRDRTTLVETGRAGPAGATGPAPSEEEVRAAVEDAVVDLTDLPPGVTVDGLVGVDGGALSSFTAAQVLASHTGDGSDAHDAAAISYAGGSGIAATDVEGALDELADEKIDKAGGMFTGDVEWRQGNVRVVMNLEPNAPDSGFLNFYRNLTDPHPVMVLGWSPFDVPTINMGNGTDPPDVTLYRSAAGVVNLNGGRFTGSGAAAAGTDLVSRDAGDARWQPLDGDLTAIAALSTTSFGRALLALADAAAARAALGLGSLALASSVTSAEIADGTIVNADVSTSAGVALSKLASIATARIVGNVSGSSAAPSELTAAQVMAMLSGGAGAAFSMGGQRITNVADPSSAQDAATKAYAELSANLAYAGAIARANHTGTQTASTISDFAETARDTIGTALVAGEAIDITVNDGADTITVDAELASDTNPGVVELATTAETQTGTDTARAVTPAGATATFAKLSDPAELGFIYTADPRLYSSVGAGVGSSNTAFYSRAIGSRTITKFGAYFTASSGNVDVGVYAGSGSGRTAAPAARRVSAGSTACPAIGWAEITVGSTATSPGDWLAWAADNTTAALTALLSGTVAVVAGLTASQATAMPLPSTATPTTGGRNHLMTGY